jgi:hypothetical protein
VLELLFTAWPWVGLAIIVLGLLPMIGMSFGMRGDIRIVLGIFLAGLGICATYWLVVLAIISTVGS